MEVAPSSKQRNWYRQWVRFAPHIYLLRWAGTKGVSSFLVYIFLRWIIVLFWVMPILILSLILVILATPFLFLWALQRRVFVVFGREWDWKLPWAVLVDTIWEITYIALLPDIWLEKQL